MDGQRRGSEKALEIRDSDKISRSVLDRLPQQGGDRQEHEDEERDAEHRKTRTHQEVVTAYLLPERLCQAGGCRCE